MNAEVTPENRGNAPDSGQGGEPAALEQKMDMLGRMGGAFAHDFNNHLAAISGNLELLERKLADRPDLLVFVREALAGAAEGAALTRKMLAFAGRQPLYPAALDPAGKIRALESELRHILGGGIRLRMELDSDIWPISADAGQFEAALKNLAANARDASGGDGEVVIAARNAELRAAYHSAFAVIEPGRYVRISVRDNGGGIDEKILPLVLDPFFSSKGGRGAGLGLSTAYGFVRQSRGHLDIECADGACVSLYFPACP
jgi:signal transduction histidine kinase